MTVLLEFRFKNSSGDQEFEVHDQVDKSDSPIATIFVASAEYSKWIACTADSRGRGWVLVVGSNPRPTDPPIKEIRYNRDEFTYAP